MKRKSHASVEKSQTSRSIPEEIIIEILGRLTLESLHRFKCASKSWLSLITREIFPKTLNPQFIGFIYRRHLRVREPFRFINNTSGDDDDGHGDTAIDPNLSFVPLNHRGFRILDCCNGLVLCRFVICKAPTYVVCNPFTKSWTRLPLTDDIPYCHNLIDFDPSISPHYKVVAVWEDGNRVFINVYRSETGRWERKRKRMNLGDCILVDCHGWALWDGDLYVQSGMGGTLIVYPYRGWYETVRFGLSGRDDDFELIMFPRGTKKPHRGQMHIGRLWGGRLGSMYLDGLRLRVWTLRGKRQKEWVLEHESTIRGLSGWYLGLPPVVVGFHPAREAVLIRCNHVIFSYDLLEMSLVEISRIGTDGEVFFDVSLFPFLPCSYDFLESRINA